MMYNDKLNCKKDYLWAFQAMLQIYMSFPSLKGQNQINKIRKPSPDHKI